jgi:hypothetical protein
MTDEKRHAPIAQPTAERSADQSTPSASGLGAARPGVNPEREDDDDRDVVARVDRGQADTPRRYEEEIDDVTASDDAAQNTKI